MGRIVPGHAKEYDHERDDLLDELAKLDEATVKGEWERVSIYRERALTHFKRIEELERLAKILEDCWETV